MADTQHVIYLAPNSHVNELYWSAGAGWKLSDLTAAAGAPNAAVGSQLTGYVLGDSQHVIYLGTDSHVRELYWSPGAGWKLNDLTAAAGAPNAAVNSHLAGYVLGDSQHVTYLGTDSHVRELYWSAGAGWKRNDLTAAAGAPNAAVGSSLTGYVLGDSQHVIYLGTDSHVRELYWSAGAGWKRNDLTAAAGAPNAAVNSDLAGYVLGDSQHVIYLAPNSHVNELYWSPGAGWKRNDLTAAAGAPNAAVNSHLAGYVLGNSQHVIYLGTDSHVRELYWSAGAGWKLSDLTAAAGAPNAAVNSDLAGYALVAEPATATVYTRRDAWALESPTVWDPTTLAYARAVREMRSRPISDPTSWAYQAAIHGSYDPVPPGADWNQCQHASWFFLPWHRMYLYWFERIVRSIVVAQGGPSDWALPYWNYSDNWPTRASLPPAFRQPQLPDNTPNPLYVTQRAPGMNTGAQLPQSAVSTTAALAYVSFPYPPNPQPGFGGFVSGPTQFDGGGGALELNPHNIIHVLVGGQTDGACGSGWMSDPNCAALDPIFWLHHSNIDRLWKVWLRQGGGRQNPPDAAWLNQQFTFYDENRNQIQMSSSEVLDTVAQLDYRYDDDPPAAAAAERAVPTPTAAAASDEAASAEAASPQTLAVLAGTTLTGEVTTLSADIESGAPPVRDRLLESPAEAPQAPHVILRVEGVEYDRNPGIVYEMYLNLPEDADQPSYETPHFVGILTFFGQGTGEGGHHGHDMVHSYDITNCVRELSAQSRWDDRSVKVTFVPRGLIMPEDTREIAPEPAPTPEARIGRVRIVSE